MTTEARIGQFMDGLVAAYELLQRAAQNGFFIEYICLAASIIDGHLRMGLIFEHQLKTCSSELLEELLLQTDIDPIIPEREIYRRAAQKVLSTMAWLASLRSYTRSGSGSPSIPNQ